MWENLSSHRYFRQFWTNALADRRIRGIFGRHVKLPVDKNRIAAERDRHNAPRTRESDDREASTESFLQNIREHLRLVRRMLLLDLTLARPNSLKVAIFAPKLKMQSYNINYLHNEQNSISISYQTHILARPHYSLIHIFIILLLQETCQPGALNVRFALPNGISF